MKKRWISTVLCAAMVAGSLAGCGLKSLIQPLRQQQRPSPKRQLRERTQRRQLTAPQRRRMHRVSLR